MAENTTKSHATSRRAHLGLILPTTDPSALSRNYVFCEQKQYFEQPRPLGALPHQWLLDIPRPAGCSQAWFSTLFELPHRSRSTLRYSKIGRLCWNLEQCHHLSLLRSLVSTVYTLYIGRQSVRTINPFRRALMLAVSVWNASNATLMPLRFEPEPPP